MISICIWENPNPEPQGGTITGGADQGQHRAIWKNKKRSGAQRTPTHDGRPDFCPLVDVPDPHGNLIDIDSKITIGIKDGLKVTTVRDLLNDRAVRLPKTVIEAEGTE